MGNQTASVIALCGLRDLNLSAEVSQMAIRDINGLTLLVNLLRTSDERCKVNDGTPSAQHCRADASKMAAVNCVCKTSYSVPGVVLAALGTLYEVLHTFTAAILDAYALRYTTFVTPVTKYICLLSFRLGRSRFYSHSPTTASITGSPSSGWEVMSSTGSNVQCALGARYQGTAHKPLAPSTSSSELGMKTKKEFMSERGERKGS